MNVITTYKYNNHEVLVQYQRATRALKSALVGTQLYL